MAVSSEVQATGAEQRHAADANQHASHRQPVRAAVVRARLMAGVICLLYDTTYFLSVHASAKDSASASHNGNNRLDCNGYDCAHVGVP